MDPVDHLREPPELSESIQICEPLEHVLDSSPNPDGVWLWCMHCNRFFQARHLRRDFLNNRQGCAFCDAAGFDVDIHLWSTFGQGSPQWPRSEAELRHGLEAW